MIAVIIHFSFHTFSRVYVIIAFNLFIQSYAVKISRNLNRNQLAHTVHLFYPRNLFRMDTYNNINPNISLLPGVDECDGNFCISIDAARRRRWRHIYMLTAMCKCVLDAKAWRIEFNARYVAYKRIANEAWKR